MTDERARLERECEVFTRFLVRQPPSAYVLAKYLDAHDKLSTLGPAQGFERVLVGAAAKGLWSARMADAYARLRAPRSVLRKKLVLLLAVLETSPPPFHNAIDTAKEGTVLAAVRRLTVAGTIGVLSAIAGLVIFGPADAFFSVRGSAK